MNRVPRTLWHALHPARDKPEQIHDLLESAAAKRVLKQLRSEGADEGNTKLAALMVLLGEHMYWHALRNTVSNKIPHTHTESADPLLIWEGEPYTSARIGPYQDSLISMRIVRADVKNFLTGANLDLDIAAIKALEGEAASHYLNAVSMILGCNRDEAIKFSREKLAGFGRQQLYQIVAGYSRIVGAWGVKGRNEIDATPHAEPLESLSQLTRAIFLNLPGILARNTQLQLASDHIAIGMATECPSAATYSVARNLLERTTFPGVRGFEDLIDRDDFSPKLAEVTGWTRKGIPKVSLRIPDEVPRITTRCPAPVALPPPRALPWAAETLNAISAYARDTGLAWPWPPQRANILMMATAVGIPHLGSLVGGRRPHGGNPLNGHETPWPQPRSGQGRIQGRLIPGPSYPGQGLPDHCRGHGEIQPGR